MKLTKKQPILQPKTEKLTLPGETAAMLDDYQQYYLETYQEPIDLHDLMTSMLFAFMKSDRDFKKFLTKKTEICSDTIAGQ